MSDLSENVASKAGERGDADRLRRLIERDLQAGRWQPGERMPTEREFSQQYGVARNTVRRSLQALEAERWLARHVGRGTFRSARAPLEPASVGFDDASFSPSDVVECRLIFEPEMAPLAVARATTVELQRMEACLDSAEAAASIPEFEHWDAAFHGLIAEATHNRSVVATARNLARVRLAAEWGQLKQRSMTAIHRAAIERQHRAILHALRDRDRDQARTEMREHIRYVRHYMFGD